MVDPGFAPGLIGAGIAELLNRLIRAIETARQCREYCISLQVVLKALQPVVSNVVTQTGQLRDSPSTALLSSTLKAWLEDLFKTLQDANGVVEECVNHCPSALWSKYRTARNILKIMERIKDFLLQAAVIGIGVSQLTLQAIQRVETKIDGLQSELQPVVALACAARDAIERGDGKDIQTAFRHVKTQVDYLRIGDDTDFTPRSLPKEEQIVPRWVFGLDERILEVRQLITSKACDVDSHYIGIWGMGGAGKTVLAKNVYNDATVQKHFDNGLVLWLTMGQSPSIATLYADLRKQLDLPEFTNCSDDTSRTTLYNVLLKKSVLLVLDDVWNDQTLECVDIAKGVGSVTLLTTRKQDILQRLRASEVNISRLSDEDSWSLFSVYAFGSVDSAPSDLEVVGKSVMGECKGLPLALKVVGSTMASKKGEGQWHLELRKLQHSSPLNEEMEVGLFHRLKWSYDELIKVDPRCQECFLYFAAYPEDELVKVKHLFQYWTGEGLVGGNEVDPIEDAHWLLGVLIGWSLIELSSPGFCQIHDVLRDLALYIIQHDPPIDKQIALFSAGKRLEHFPREWYMSLKGPLAARKMSLCDNKLQHVPNHVQPPKLTTIILARNEISGDFPMCFLRGLSQLRVLDLRGNNLVTLPSSLGDLKDLRLLDLAGNIALKFLPHSITRLRALEILDLSCCGSLQYLPRGLRKLTSLQRLDLLGCRRVWNKRSSSMTLLDPATYIGAQWRPLTLVDVCELSSLRTLTLSGSESYATLPNQMSALVKMKKLEIRDFPKLTRLPEEMVTLVELEDLTIADCGLLALPSWITSSVQLSSFNVHHCPKLTDLSSFESPPQLRHLSFIGCSSITSLPTSLGRAGAFPSLTRLNLTDCSCLLKFPVFEQGACPQLSLLYVAGCRELKALPPSLKFLPNLKEVILDGTRFW